MSEEQMTGLALLRKPFAVHQISKLPKPTKQQTEDVKADFTKGTRCAECGAWHHPKVVHLDYVGHAALTDRLLDADPSWTWAPLSMGSEGLPVMDNVGGMWIKLTVCGVTRLGYGQASPKNADADATGNAIKEVIGDALRNAAMRFGAALDLWHKGELHVAEKRVMPESELLDWKATIDGAATVGDLKRLTAEAEAACNEYRDADALASVRACSAAKAAKARK